MNGRHVHRWRGCKRSVPARRVGRWRRRARLQDEQVGWCGLCAKTRGWEKRRQWRCMGGIQVGLARARQQKAFHTGPSYGAVSRKISCFGVDHHRAADCKGGGAGCRVQGAGWMQGAGCGVRAGCVRCGQGGHRQRPGDGCAISLQEISIVRQKKDSSAGRAVRGCGSGARCEGGARAVRWVRPLSRQGISTACPLGTDLGMSGSSSASKGGQGGGRGRAALGGADFSERATARAARACAGEGAVPRPHARLQRWGLGGQKGLRSEAEGAVRRQGSARRRGEGRGEGSEISCGIGSPHPRVSGVGIRVFVLALPPPHPTAHRRVGVLASYKWV